MLIWGDSKAEICPNKEPRSRWVPFYLTRLNQKTKRKVVSRRELGSENLEIVIEYYQY